MFESRKCGAKATTRKGSVRLSLVEISGMFYLEADSTEQKWIPSEERTRSPKGSNRMVYPVADDSMEAEDGSTWDQRGLEEPPDESGDQEGEVKDEVSDDEDKPDIRDTAWSPEGMKTETPEPDFCISMDELVSDGSVLRDICNSCLIRLRLFR